MGGWIKHIYGNQKEYGTDDLIEKKLASWSKGKLESIHGVTLFNDSQFVCNLSVPLTEWHQFDRFCMIASNTGAETRRLARVVQAKITEQHIGMNLYECKSNVNNKSSVYYFLKQLDVGHGGDQILLPYTIGKWLSMILLPENKSIIQIADDKGSIKWQELHI